MGIFGVWKMQSERREAFCSKSKGVNVHLRVCFNSSFICKVYISTLISKGITHWILISDGKLILFYNECTVYVKVAQSCLTLFDPRLQPARLPCPWDSPGKNTGVGCLPSSRGSSPPRDWTCISYVSCIGRWGFFFNHWHHLSGLIADVLWNFQDFGPIALCWDRAGEALMII